MAALRLVKQSAWAPTDCSNRHNSTSKDWEAEHTIAHLLRNMRAHMMTAARGASSMSRSTRLTAKRMSVYGANKASMLGFTRSLAREVGKGGVTVMPVAPGAWIPRDAKTEGLSATRHRGRAAIRDWWKWKTSGQCALPERTPPRTPPAPPMTGEREIGSNRLIISGPEVVPRRSWAYCPHSYSLRLRSR